MNRFSNLSNEVKICLPLYKIVYSLCFVILLSLVRGISSVDEIGIALDANMAILALAFCADALQMEYTQKRWEVFLLYPEKTRHKVVVKRIVIQCLYLWLLSALGYGCFFWQNPRRVERVLGIQIYGTFLAAVVVSIFFFGTIAFWFANLCRSALAGMGISIVLWMAVNSKMGDNILGNFNVFAYVFREIPDAQGIEDMGWLLGKGIAVLMTVMILLLPLSVSNRKWDNLINEQERRTKEQ